MASPRAAFKALADTAALFLVLPVLVGYRLGALVLPGRRDLLFQHAGQALSLLPGFLGVLCRRAFYRSTLAACSGSVWIGFGTLFSKPETEIGDNVSIGANCMIGLATIGPGTLLGSNVDIPSGKSQHGFDDPETPMRLQQGVFNRVSIGADVWLGNGCIVLVDVGDHAIVAAGAVVVHPVEPWSIVGGNPARVLGTRRSADTAGLGSI